MRPPTARNFHVALCLLSFFAVRAQMLYQSGAEIERRDLVSTITYVQLTGNVAYDSKLREAFATGWHQTRGVEFVPFGEPLGDPKDTRRSYISIWHETHSYWFKTYDFVFWQGNPIWDGVSDSSETSFYGKAYWNSWIVSIPLDTRLEMDSGTCAWRIPMMIRTIDQMVQYAKERSTRPGTTGYPASLVKDLKTEELARKILLVPNNAFNANDIAALRKDYPFRIDHVDMERIQQVIDERDPLYAILFRMQHIYNDVTVYDAATYEMLYAQRDLHGELTPKTVKHLAREVD